MTRKIFLSVGSNVGQREAHLSAAVGLLREQTDVHHISSVWSTKPVGVTAQPDFLNIAVATQSDLQPMDVLALVKRIEHEVGRRPTYRWGPRVIDIDIILFGDLVVDSPALTIPHREMANRAFVLAPLSEIAAGEVDPRSGLSIVQMLEHLRDTASVERVGMLDTRIVRP